MYKKNFKFFENFYQVDGTFVGGDESVPIVEPDAPIPVSDVPIPVSDVPITEPDLQAQSQTDTATVTDTEKQNVDDVIAVNPEEAVSLQNNLIDETSKIIEQSIP
jgi:hypothetical protein